MRVWKWLTAGRAPKFVPKQKASPLTGFINTQTLQISCQLHWASERETRTEGGGGGCFRWKAGRNSRRETRCTRKGK